MFLRNAWYVAGSDGEVGSEPRCTRVLGQDIVLYRTHSGAPVALEDLCPHRQLPLSMGRVRDDHIECGYHGLCFDRTGACVRMPGVGRIPAAVRVRSYPAVSRHGLVWVWMGSEAAADPEKIFRIEHAGEEGWGRNSGGSMEVGCHYLHITDNLLDPSHVTWVHQGSFGSAAGADDAVQVTQTEQGVTAWRWMKAMAVAPFYAPFVAFAGPCDRLQQYEVRFPSHALVRAILVPAGAGGEGAANHPQALVMDSYNFITPQQADCSRYFWFQVRNFAPRDPHVSQLLDEGVRAAFAEDRVILDAVQRGSQRPSRPAIALPGDRAGLIFRKRLNSMVAAEQAQARD